MEWIGYIEIGFSESTTPKRICSAFWWRISRFQFSMSTRCTHARRTVQMVWFLWLQPSKVVHTWYCQLFELLDVWFKIRKLCAYGATDTSTIASINLPETAASNPSTDELSLSPLASLPLTTLILFGRQSCKLYTIARFSCFAHPHRNCIQCKTVNNTSLILRTHNK